MKEKDETIQCPECGFEISVSKVLTQRIEKRLNLQKEEEIERVKAEAKEEASRDFELERTDFENQMKETKRELETARATELKLRTRERSVQQREENFELEIQRRLSKDSEKIKVESIEQAEKKYKLELESKDKVITDLTEKVEEATRSAAQGSVQRQGEILELHTEEELKRIFPQDTIEPVPKGVRGADVMQTVIDGGRNCGIILWECKRTKTWGNDWIPKLKEEQREIGAALAIIITETMPKEIDNFGLLDGVWVTSYDSAIPLAMALRESLKEIAFARATSEGKSGKKEVLYNYLTGPEFRQKIEAIVETFTDMRNSLTKERIAMEKIWKVREGQIKQIMKNTVGMYSEMKAIAGASIQDIPALELNDSSEVKELPPGQ